MNAELAHILALQRVRNLALAFLQSTKRNGG